MTLLGRHYQMTFTTQKQPILYLESCNFRSSVPEQHRTKPTTWTPLSFFKYLNIVIISSLRFLFRFQKFRTFEDSFYCQISKSLIYQSHLFRWPFVLCLSFFKCVWGLKAIYSAKVIQQVQSTITFNNLHTLFYDSIVKLSYYVYQPQNTLKLYLDCLSYMTILFLYNGFFLIEGLYFISIPL